jgi:carboxylesterase type B
MMTMWAQFAKTGSPNAKKKGIWQAYEAASDQYLYIDEKLEAKTGFSKIKKE